MNRSEPYRNDFIENLVSVSAFVEERSTLDDSLTEFCSLVAKTLGTANCSIMLLKERENELQELRVEAHYGYLPASAYATTSKLDTGIAGHVATTGMPLLVEDIAGFDLKDTLHDRPQVPGGFISFPIIMEGSVIGVINVNSPLDGRVFQEHDLDLARILGLFIAKSIQTLHLKNLLKSGFAVAALAHDKAYKHAQPHAARPEQLAPILAKSFYENLRQLGMGDDHILRTTTEIIDLLLKKDD